MAYQRDPLSVGFDTGAREMIDRAIANAGKSVAAFVESRPGEPVDAGGLTRSERAFQRALYHDHRIYKPRKNSGGPWSLPHPSWLARTGRNRLVRITVHSDLSGRVHTLASTPRSKQWQHNPDLQSGGQGSPKARFG